MRFLPYEHWLPQQKLKVIVLVGVLRAQLTAQIGNLGDKHTALKLELLGYGIGRIWPL